MIGPLLATDAPRCAQLESAIFAGDSPWPVEAFTAELASPHNRYFAVRGDDDVLIGYAGVTVLGRPGDMECEIHTIAVDPDHRGGGHGRALMAEMLSVVETRRVFARGRLAIGDPCDAIIAVAPLGYDLIVMGSHGRSNFIHRIFGGLAAKIADLSACPVVLVHAA